MRCGYRMNDAICRYICIKSHNKRHKCVILPHKNRKLTKYIPSALTLSNLFCGFAGILLADLFWSPVLLMLCFIFDSLDGAAARWFNAQSDFGKELDSLADIVSFGVFPAFLYFQLSPVDNSQILTVAVCGIIVLAGAVRLAKFNITASKPYFNGLPIPANAIFYAGILMSQQWGNDLYHDMYSTPWMYVTISLLMSVMMVSFRIRLFTTKGISRIHRKNIYHYAMLVLCILCVITLRFDSLPLIITAYIFLSVINTLTDQSENTIQRI